ncbi:MAG: hypothetical protein WA705_02825 [Candidatus Ozemobacteraceae bacterium]
MKTLPTRCVVDTNVATTANGRNPGASPKCVAASAKALQIVMTEGHVFIDSENRIVSEYRANLHAKGQPGPGDSFLKWLLTHEWNNSRVTHVVITPQPTDPEDFHELPMTSSGISYDRSDRKFLAVAAAHPEHPYLLQSFDSKWWGWQADLAHIGVFIHFLCPEDIAKKYKEKMS